ncbi:MAG: CAP domain-containing protein [Leptolyngbyaceae cyanobacterium CRU_2_3]|nr:CAP domain-containing protein [Leptolyngbyaceae cyanobacterium CRU_2_3]
MERSILQQINQYRQKKRLSSLRTNPAIRRQARQHSRDMSNRHVLTHNGFDLRVDNISKSIAYRSAAENVAYNWGFSAPERQAVEGWIKSAGHRENIEGDYDLTGIGVAKNAQGEYYFTQIFIKR